MVGGGVRGAASYLLVVVDDVQFTDTSKVLIKKLYEVVDDLESQQLIISFI